MYPSLPENGLIVPILLIGAPGAGKSTLARAWLASQCSRSMIYVSSLHPARLDRELGPWRSTGSAWCRPGSVLGVGLRSGRVPILARCPAGQELQGVRGRGAGVGTVHGDGQPLFAGQVQAFVD